MTNAIKQFLHPFLSNKTDWKTLLLHHWPSIIGDLHDRVTIEKIHEDFLILGVFDSSWLQELYLLSPIILQTINANLDQPRIKHLRFKQVGTKKKVATNTNKQLPASKEIVKFTAKEEHALSRIEDPQLKNALKKLLIRCYQEKL